MRRDSNNVNNIRYKCGQFSNHSHVQEFIQPIQQHEGRKNNSPSPRPELPANHPGRALVEDNAVREPFPAGENVAEQGRNAGLSRKVAAESPHRLRVLRFCTRKTRTNTHEGTSEEENNAHSHSASLVVIRCSYSTSSSYIQVRA